MWEGMLRGIGRAGSSPLLLSPSRWRSCRAAVAEVTQVTAVTEVTEVAEAKKQRTNGCQLGAGAASSQGRGGDGTGRMTRVLKSALVIAER